MRAGLAEAPLISHANQILPTAFLTVSQKEGFGMLFPAGDFS